MWEPNVKMHTKLVVKYLILPVIYDYREKGVVLTESSAGIMTVQMKKLLVLSYSILHRMLNLAEPVDSRASF